MSIPPAAQSLIEALAQEIGVRPRTVMQWRGRGRVPDKHRLRILTLAASRGLTIDPAHFDGLSTFGSSRRSVERAVSSNDHSPLTNQDGLVVPVCTP